MGGNEEQQGSVRFGGKIDDDTYFRVYGKYRNFDNFNVANGGDAHDGWQDVRSGFRVDRFVAPIRHSPFRATLTTSGSARP